MELGHLKPLLTTLVLPPAGPLLLILVAVWWGRAGRVVAALAALALWVAACPGSGVFLSRHLLDLPPPIGRVDLQRARVQAVVVLGGGVRPQAPEYGEPQPGNPTLQRLRYGVRLARQGRLPLGFAGGVGWAGNGLASEAQAVLASARQDFGQELRWLDDRSRDTEENARFMAELLRRDGVRRIALVSDAWHLPRAAALFRRQGLEVLPAPTGFLLPEETPLLEWLPSARGLMDSRAVLREWLGLQVLRWQRP